MRAAKRSVPRDSAALVMGVGAVLGLISVACDELPVRPGADFEAHWRSAKHISFDQRTTPQLAQYEVTGCANFTAALVPADGGAGQAVPIEQVPVTGAAGFFQFELQLRTLLGPTSTCDASRVNPWRGQWSVQVTCSQDGRTVLTEPVLIEWIAAERVLQPGPTPVQSLFDGVHEGSFAAWGSGLLAYYEGTGDSSSTNDTNDSIPYLLRDVYGDTEGAPLFVRVDDSFMTLRAQRVHVASDISIWSWVQRWHVDRTAGTLAVEGDWTLDGWTSAMWVAPYGKVVCHELNDGSDLIRILQEGGNYDFEYASGFGSYVRRIGRPLPLDPSHVRYLLVQQDAAVGVVQENRGSTGSPAWWFEIPEAQGPIDHAELDSTGNEAVVLSAAELWHVYNQGQSSAQLVGSVARAWTAGDFHQSFWGTRHVLAWSSRRVEGFDLDTNSLWFSYDLDLEVASDAELRITSVSMPEAGGYLVVGTSDGMRVLDVGGVNAVVIGDLESLPCGGKPTAAATAVGTHHAAVAFDDLVFVLDVSKMTPELPVAGESKPPQ